MSRFYQVAGLKPGREIAENAYALRVDVSKALLGSFLYNDEDLFSTRQKGEYIWASGGGTCLLNERYLLVVQRAQDARVNPGKFSLFTGRSNSTEELLHPTMLVRELFEELLLFSGQSLYRPDCEGFRRVIDQVYSRLEKDLGLEIAAAKPLCLEYLLCAPRLVSVSNQDYIWKGLLDCHVDSNGEVNILFVFRAEVEIDKLRAMDGEYHMTSGKAIRHNRSIYLYDLHTTTLKDITINSRVDELMEISEDAMTEHLHHLVVSIRRKLAIGKSSQSLISK